MSRPYPVVQRAVADLAAIAAASESRQAFHREGLDAIGRMVGFDTAFIARFDVREVGGPTIAGFDSAYYAALQVRRDAYIAGLAPLFRVAEASRGVAQDLDVYSSRSFDRMPIYAECIRAQSHVRSDRDRHAAGRGPAAGRDAAGSRRSRRALRRDVAWCSTRLTHARAIGRVAHLHSDDGYTQATVTCEGRDYPLEYGSDACRSLFTQAPCSSGPCRR